MVSEPANSFSRKRVLSEAAIRTKPHRVVVLVNDDFDVVARPPVTDLSERVFSGDRLDRSIEREARALAGASETVLVGHDLAMTVTRLAGSTDPRTALVFQEVYYRAGDPSENS